MVDQPQSEQGARFLHKRNRNIIVEVEESDPIGNTGWLYLIIIRSDKRIDLLSECS
ncbi:MAG: NDP-hexose 2,3-dehydratase family protein [Parabacteroides merdae]